MTSLNAPGFSASLLNVSNITRFPALKSNVDTYSLLDAPTDAHSWVGVRAYWMERNIGLNGVEDLDYFPEKTQLTRPAGALTRKPPQEIREALRLACESVLKIEKELTEYDTVAGDGDCGHTFAAGARGEPYSVLTTSQVLIKLSSHSLRNPESAVSPLGTRPSCAH